MDDHQRHHARRAFFRSKLNAQYRNYSMLFVPRATLYGMHKYSFDMPHGSSSEIVAQMLQIAKKWHQIREDYSADCQANRAKYSADEQEDHALQNAILCFSSRPGTHAKDTLNCPH
jgi:hypothetical protein